MRKRGYVASDVIGKRTQGLLLLFIFFGLFFFLFSLLKYLFTMPQVTAFALLFSCAALVDTPSPGLNNCYVAPATGPLTASKYYSTDC
jgi:hypothetical protein